MNLNSYIGLMGGSYREVATPLGAALVPARAPTRPTCTVPDPDYVLTLDADSVLLPEYCVRLVYLHGAERPRRGRRGPDAVQRVPGLGDADRADRRRDHRHPAHRAPGHDPLRRHVLGRRQRVLRKRALDDIVEIDHEGDWEIRRYIQDRTVIEDTESTIDLGVHGWTLLNYPERLAYSATPPDFGSLCIQRQRWANGGLLILPKLREQSQARKARGEQNRFGEVFLRVNYMASIFWASICLLILLVLPVQQRPAQPDPAARSPLPYFVMMADRPALLRVQAPRRAADLRLQPDPAAGQPVGQVRVDPAADHRREERVQAHAEGRATARPRRRAYHPRPDGADRLRGYTSCSTCGCTSGSNLVFAASTRCWRCTRWSRSSGSATVSSTSGCSCGRGCTGRCPRQAAGRQARPAACSTVPLLPGDR